MGSSLENIVERPLARKEDGGFLLKNTILLLHDLVALPDSPPLLSLLIDCETIYVNHMTKLVSKSAQQFHKNKSSDVKLVFF